MPILVLQVRKINISLNLNELRKTFICSECLEKIDSSLHKAVSQGEDKKKSLSYVYLHGCLHWPFRMTGKNKHSVSPPSNHFSVAQYEWPNNGSKIYSDTVSEFGPKA